MKKFHKPRALELGDTIALIRPAGRLDESAFHSTAKTLRQMGFCVALYPHSIKRDKFFAASDEDRARELHWAFSEPGIKAVLTCRGGYGSARALSKIRSTDLQKWKPKLLVGYSDITYLHQWLQNKLKWTTIHGPLAGRISSAELKKFVRGLVNLPSSSSQETWSEIKNIGAKNSARGILVGGNLSLFQVAGPAQLPRVPMILAIEDVNEDFYRLDRMLMALKDAGYSPFIRGIILGSLLNCGEKDAKTFGRDRLMMSLKNLTKGPIWVGARFGHGVKHQRLLPLGCQVQIYKKRFSILEPVVRKN
jgi:muramoyltetrapeptide carboxypeptidase